MLWIILHQIFHILVNFQHKRLRLSYKIPRFKSSLDWRANLLLTKVALKSRSECSKIKIKVLLRACMQVSYKSLFFLERASLFSSSQIILLLKVCWKYQCYAIKVSQLKSHVNGQMFSFYCLWNWIQNGNYWISKPR